MSLRRAHCPATYRDGRTDRLSSRCCKVAGRLRSRFRQGYHTRENPDQYRRCADRLCRWTVERSGHAQCRRGDVELPIRRTGVEGAEGAGHRELPADDLCRGQLPGRAHHGAGAGAGDDPGRDAARDAFGAALPAAGDQRGRSVENVRAYVRRGQPRGLWRHRMGRHGG